MARDESFTYNSITIGGSGATVPSQILDRFGLNENCDADGTSYAEFTCRFVISGTSVSNLAANKATIENALRTYRAGLSVSFGGTVMFVSTPSVATTGQLGLNAAPVLDKLTDATSTGLSQGYEFRVRILLPVVLAAQSWLQGASVNLHSDVSERPTVTITGSYTASPTTTSPAVAGRQARETYDAYAETYCRARLVLIDPAATWTLTDQDAPEDDARAVLGTFRRVYSRQIDGRRGSTYKIDYLPSGLRRITIRGTYLRTLATASPLQAAAAATVNYATYEPTHSAAILAAFTTAQGGALTVGDDAELARQDVTPNEQDDRLEFTRIYNELIARQSPEATDLDDPEIIDDTMLFSSIREPFADSPVPQETAGGQSSGLPPSGAAVVTRAGGNPIGGSAPATVSRSGPVPGGAPQTLSPGGGSGQSTQVRRFVRFVIRYQASFRVGVDLNDKLANVVAPYLLARIPAVLGLAVVAIDSFVPTLDVTHSTVTCDILARGVEGDLFEFHETNRVGEDAGVRLDPAYTGSPHDYYVQQGLQRRTRVRVMSAVFRSGGSFSLGNLLLPVVTIPGWVRQGPVTTDAETKVTGIYALGSGPVAVESGSTTENFVWVARNVAGSAGGSSAPVAGQAPATVGR